MHIFLQPVNVDTAPLMFDQLQFHEKDNAYENNLSLLFQVGAMRSTWQLGMQDHK